MHGYGHCKGLAPAVQLTQSDKLRPDDELPKVPGGHGTGSPLPAGQYAPAGQRPPNGPSVGSGTAEPPRQ